MKLAKFRTRRLRLRLACVVLLALLFQQIAMAAYTCPQAGMAGCEGMAMPDRDAPALCEKHCHPDTSTIPDLRLAQVPPLILPPLHFDLAANLLPPPAPAQRYADVSVCRSDPPPALRFCSLQI